MEYFAKSLKITQGFSKWHCCVRRVLVPISISLKLCLYIEPFEIFRVKEWRDLETKGRGRSRSLKMTPFDIADYWQTRSIARPLCDSRATCILSYAGPIHLRDHRSAGAPNIVRSTIWAHDVTWRDWSYFSRRRDVNSWASDLGLLSAADRRPNVTELFGQNTGVWQTDGQTSCDSIVRDTHSIVR